jgi:hypothetical protein
MSAGETIKVESPMGFYHSPTGVLLSILGFTPILYKWEIKIMGDLEKNKKIIVVVFKYFIV